MSYSFFREQLWGIKGPSSFQPDMSTATRHAMTTSTDWSAQDWRPFISSCALPHWPPEHSQIIYDLAVAANAADNVHFLLSNSGWVMLAWLSLYSHQCPQRTAKIAVCEPGESFPARPPVEVRRSPTSRVLSVDVPGIAVVSIAVLTGATHNTTSTHGPRPYLVLHNRIEHSTWSTQV